MKTLDPVVAAGSGGGVQGVAAGEAALLLPQRARRHHPQLRGGVAHPAGPRLPAQPRRGAPPRPGLGNTASKLVLQTIRRFHNWFSHNHVEGSYKGLSALSHSREYYVMTLYQML